MVVVVHETRLTAAVGVPTLQAQSAGPTRGQSQGSHGQRDQLQHDADRRQKGPAGDAVFICFALFGREELFSLRGHCPAVAFTLIPWNGFVGLSAVFFPLGCTKLVDHNLP